MEDESIAYKLDKIQATLDRIEARQITVREEIKEQVAPAVGSFATTDSGKEDK